MAETHASQHWEAKEQLRAFGDPDDRAFVDYVKRLEQSLDLGKYGELARAADGGILTRSGYLVPLAGELPQRYTGPRDIPAGHRVTGAPEITERKPSLLGAVAALQESQARQDAQERPSPCLEASTGLEL